PERLEEAAQHSLSLPGYEPGVTRLQPGHRSHMDRALADRKRRFLDRLGARGMRMAGAGEVLCRTAKFHQNRSFMNHFTGFDADDVHAEHAIGFRICEN